MKIFFLYTFFIITLSYSQSLPPFKESDQPIAPNYSNEKNWSALPFRIDAADMTPKNEKWLNDSLKEVDVFYIYPTLYLKGETWNADINNEKLNNRLDKYPVRFQASIFNKVCRVYAPRYRQAHINSFYDTTGSGQKALDLAYEDVKKAFEYYMSHYNKGRPVIIASHSQGSTHARRLLKDYFDTPEMKQKLVCAYVVGFAMYPDKYSVLKPCSDPKETNCYVNWASFKYGYIPDSTSQLFGKICVNPVTWKQDTISAIGKGGILLNVNRKKHYESDTRINGHYLWVKTNMPLMQKRDILHLVDFNLYWFDIRKNVSERVDEYLKKSASH